MKTLGRLFVVAIFVSIVCGCTLIPPVATTTTTTTVFKNIVLLPDNRFNGDFVYSNYWIANDGIDEINDYLSIEFDGTNRFEYWHKYKNYTSTGGWKTSPGFGSEFYHFVLEIQTNGTQYRERAWFEKQESDWGPWESYSFAGNTLTLSNILGKTYVLSK